MAICKACGGIGRVELEPPHLTRRKADTTECPECEFNYTPSQIIEASLDPLSNTIGRISMKMSETFAAYLDMRVMEILKSLGVNPGDAKEKGFEIISFDGLFPEPRWIIAMHGTPLTGWIYWRWENGFFLVETFDYVSQRKMLPLR